MAFGTGNVDVIAAIFECLAEAHFELVKLHTVGAPDSIGRTEMVDLKLDCIEFGRV